MASYLARSFSEAGVGSLYSPSHDVVVSRIDAKHVKATFKAMETRPESDFLLYWGETASELGATVLTYWPRGEDRDVDDQLGT